MSTPLPRELMATVPQIKRAVAALGIGIAVMVAVFFLMNDRTVYPPIVAAGGAAALTLVLLEKRAARKWRRDSFASARVLVR